MSELAAIGFAEWLVKWKDLIGPAIGLIGAAVALTAAFVAVRPVWRQLREMRAQSAVQLHEMLCRVELGVAADLQLAYRCLAFRRSLVEEIGLILDQSDAEKAGQLWYEFYRTYPASAGKLIDDLMQPGPNLHWGSGKQRSNREAVPVYMESLRHVFWAINGDLVKRIDPGGTVTHSLDTDFLRQSWEKYDRTLRDLTFQFERDAYEERNKLLALIERAHEQSTAGI